MDNFLSGRKKLSANQLPAEAHLPSGANTAFAKVEVVSATAGEPKVELVTEKGLIQAIVITCKCGERVELKCHY